MSRAPELNYEKMSDEQKKVYDEIASGPRGGVRGPLGVWLTRPGLADRAQNLGAYCRYDSLLPPKLSELAIIATARLWGAAYEWFAHSAIALKAGVTSKTVDAMRLGIIPEFDDPDQSIVFEFAVALHVDRRVSDDLFDRAVEQLGKDTVVDLVGILGYYALISMTLNTFEVPLVNAEDAEQIRLMPELAEGTLVFGRDITH
jgi:4-carboxymuconolactone decarboxylase